MTLEVLPPGPLRHRLPHRNPFAIVGWPFATAMRGGRGPKRGPCAVVGCKDPESPSGQWNWLPPEEDLAGLEVELQPDAVCFCQKVDCRAAMGKGTRKRKLKEHMAGLGANDPCVPSQYQVKEITEIWGVRYAPNAAEPPSPPYSPCPLRLRQARGQPGPAPRDRDGRALVGGRGGERLGLWAAISRYYRNITW